MLLGLVARVVPATVLTPADGIGIGQVAVSERAGVGSISRAARRRLAAFLYEAKLVVLELLAWPP